MQQYYGDNFGMACAASFFSPVIYITAFNILENIVLAGVNGSYICECKFSYNYNLNIFFIDKIIYDSLLF